MELLRSIQLYAEARDMPFLVIGGQAINAHGLSRQTGDLDLLVPERQRADWRALMDRVHYSAIQEDANFARYQPPDLAAWPIDFMFVDDATFERLYGDSAEMAIGVAEVRVASARHLVALKVHALNQRQPHRFSRDFGDVVGLLRSGAAGLTPEELRAMCLRYADAALYDTIARELDH